MIVNNQRIAKNTLMLYGRTALTLLISLFTSRITLQLLGVDNYGIQNAVGGFVAMFGVVTGSLSNSISRFITFELGHGDIDKLKMIFSTSINIQLIIGTIVLLLGETIGLWFLNTQMNIPSSRMIAANWVYQFAIWSFFIDLTQLPYSACITGHEKMSVFAYFSIADSIFHLMIVLLLYCSPYDKLITLSFLGFLVSVGLRMGQRIYCVKTFQECHYHFFIDKTLTKEMTGFAGWSFLTYTAWMFNSQGINVLINIFFGVAFNAARGIAATVEGFVMKFCNDFTTAMNPQITKSYAAGEISAMNDLICRGTRLSFYLLFVLSFPLMFEAQRILEIWLGIVPDNTVVFFRLSMIATLINMLGKTGIIACMATGRIKWYTIIISSIGALVFPLTWFSYKLGAAVETAYIIFIIIYIVLDIVRLFIMKYLWGFPIMMFVKETIFPIIYVVSLSTIAPLLLYFYYADCSYRIVIIIPVSILVCLLTIFCVGLKEGEKVFVREKIINFVQHFCLRK